MHICYVDESGNDQVLETYDAPPVLTIMGMVVSEAVAKDLLWEFLRIKKAFNPQIDHDQAKLTDIIRYEIKGADLRADIRSGKRRRSRRAIGLLDAVMKLLEEYNVTILGDVWIKCDGKGVPQSYYPTAISEIAASFHAQLAAADSQGLMILDARTKSKNVPSVHGITTRKFRTGGDQLPRMMESPVFGHSDSHVMLQVADIVASALIFPLACAAYCAEVQNNAHPHDAYQLIRDRFGSRLRDLEHRYTDTNGVRRGGVVVRDKRGSGQALDLYRPRSTATTRLPSGRGDRQRSRTRAGQPTGRHRRPGAAE